MNVSMWDGDVMNTKVFMIEIGGLLLIGVIEKQKTPVYMEICKR